MRWTRGPIVGCLACLLLTSLWLSAAPKPKAPPRSVPSPLGIARVRVEVRQARVLVTTDLSIPSGNPVSEDIDIHVGYGGPGIPSAFDAQLLSTPKGYLVAPLDHRGDRLSHAGSKRSPSHAAFSLGRAELAGALVHVPAALLTAKLSSTGQATLRLREVRDLPPTLADGTREIVARLGASQGRPLVLGLIEVASDSSIARVEARFCGLEAKPTRLFVSSAAAVREGVAPPLAARSASDDLCVRFGPAAQPVSSASSGLNVKPQP